MAAPFSHLGGVVLSSSAQKVITAVEDIEYESDVAAIALTVVAMQAEFKNASTWTITAISPNQKDPYSLTVDLKSTVDPNITKSSLLHKRAAGATVELFNALITLTEHKLWMPITVKVAFRKDDGGVDRIVRCWKTE